MTNTIALEIKNLTFGYKKALSSPISLSINANEFVTVMGENGCGKTTFIDCLMGVQQPLTGEIFFWGRPNTGRHRQYINQRIGWVISQKENYPLLLTIEKFLTFIATEYPTWDWDICRKLAREFGLDLKKKLFTLSMGEHSKVRLIKALAFRPELVVLDELTANLSPTSKDSLLAALLELFAAEKTGVLYICHSKEEASRLSDRVYDMTISGLKLKGSSNV